jgi:hypothetical protein
MVVLLLRCFRTVDDLDSSSSPHGRSVRVLTGCSCKRLAVCPGIAESAGKNCACAVPEVAVSPALGRGNRSPITRSPHNNSSQPATFLRWQRGPLLAARVARPQAMVPKASSESICHVRRRSRAQSAARTVVRTAVPSLAIPLAQAIGPDGRPSHRRWHALKSRPVKTQTKWHGSLVEKVGGPSSKTKLKRGVCTPGLAGNRLCT